MASVNMKLTLDGEWLAHALMKHVLEEIAKPAWEREMGAQEMAEEALDMVAQLEEKSDDSPTG